MELEALRLVELRVEITEGSGCACVERRQRKRKCWWQIGQQIAPALLSAGAPPRAAPEPFPPQPPPSPQALAQALVAPRSSPSPEPQTMELGAAAMEA